MEATSPLSDTKAEVARLARAATGGVISAAEASEVLGRDLSFSEDLDFSLLPDGRYTEDELRGILREIAELVAEWSGLQFDREGFSVRARVESSVARRSRERLDIAGRSPFPDGRGFSST